MNTANQMAEEIYGLHCDIGRLENEKEHWHTEFINEQEYAHWMEEQAEKTEAENAKLREAIAKAVHVQTVLCADKDAPWCRNECQLHRAESDDCEACDVLEVVQELGIETSE